GRAGRTWTRCAPSVPRSRGWPGPPGRTPPPRRSCRRPRRPAARRRRARARPRGPSARRSPGRASEQLLRGRLRGQLEQLPRAAPEVGEIDAAGLGLLGEPLRELERLVDELRVAGGLLAHVVEDRPLGAGGDDRLGDPLDPHLRAAAAAATRV